MSKSDHSKSRLDRFNDGERVTRRYMRVNEREAIAASIADNDFALRRRATVAAHVDHPLVQPLTYTSGSASTLSPFAALVEDTSAMPVGTSVEAMGERYEYERATAEYEFAQFTKRKTISRQRVQMVPRHEHIHAKTLMNTDRRSIASAGFDL